MARTIPKVYTHGSIGQGEQISECFKKLGADNPIEYKFNDPWVLYYVDRNCQVAITEPGTDLYYAITTSGEWVEMKLKHPKKVHKYLVTLKEGTSSCDGCHAVGKCTDQQKTKCQIAALLSNLTGNGLSGKVLEIEEVNCCNTGS